MKASKTEPEPDPIRDCKGLWTYARGLASKLEISPEKALLVLILYELKCLHDHMDIEMQRKKHHVDGKRSKQR